MDPIVIIGGGVAGLSVAYHLRDLSEEVILLEKNALGSGTTSRSVAVFDRYIHTDDAGQEIVSRSWDVYGEMVEEGDLTFDVVGFMQVADSNSHFSDISANAEKLNEIGIETRILTPEETAEYNLDPDSVGAGAIFVPEMGRLDPGEIVAVLSEEARTAGVTIETGVEVTNIKTENNSVTAVETSEGEFDAGTVVNAGGPWANRINEMVDESLPLRHTYGPVIVLETSENLNIPITIFENGYYFLPDTRSRYFAGHSPQEELGERYYDEASVLVDPDDAHSVSESFMLDVAELTSTTVPAFQDAEMTNSWECLRSVTLDRFPIVGETNVDSFYVMTGLSGAGITRGPGVASILAEQITTGESSGPVNRLSPYRFSTLDDGE